MSLPILYKSTENNFSHNGEGILKDTIKAIVVYERNGKFELELTYKVGSFLYNKLSCGSIIKANATKKLRNQLFRIYKISNTMKNIITVYAQHISYDLLGNFIPEINLVNASCNIALQAIKDNCAFEHKFNFSTDITHTSDFKIERKNPVEALKGTEGSIVDTYGNGATIVRDNFNIKIMQHYGEDNNILIAYKKNLTDLDGGPDISNLVTGIYPYAILQKGIDSNTSIDEEIILLPEKYIYSEKVNDYYQPFIVPLDFSGDDVTNVEQLRKKAEKYFNKNSDSIKETYKINFKSISNTKSYENLEKLESIEPSDYVIVRDERFNINTKTRVVKTTFDILNNEYIGIELGDINSTLASNNKSQIDDVKNQINKVNNFWQQAVQHATSQITGNRGGYVRVWPPDKPSEILFMDTDNPNTARNILRINREGIGFSNNGVNGPFRTAWTSDGTFYAEFITAGILSAIMLQNQDGSLQIDLSSRNGIVTKQNGKRAIELAGTILKFYDWDGNGSPVGHIQTEHHNNSSASGISLAHLLNRYAAIAYQKNGNNYGHYVVFDKNNATGTNQYPITVYENISLNNRLLALDNSNNNSLYNSESNNMVGRCKNNFYLIDKDTGRNMLEIHKKGFTLYQDGDDILYTTVANTIQSDRSFHINGSLTVRDNKNCVQKTKNYGDRAFYATEDMESYFTYTNPHSFNVEITENNTYERVILIDSIYKECVNLDIDYIVDIHKVGWGDYRIKEQTKDYFIIESNSKDFEFKYTIKAKRRGFENEFSREIFDLDNSEMKNIKKNSLDTNYKVFNTNHRDLNTDQDLFNLDFWRLYKK